jgi:hypothetical protein
MMQWIVDHWAGLLTAFSGPLVVTYLWSTRETDRARYEVLSSDMAKVLAQLARLEDRLRTSEGDVRDHSSETRESTPPPADRV